MTLAPKRRWFSFSLRTLLLAVTFTSIAFGGLLALLNRGLATEVEWSFTLRIVVVISPAWVPFAFLGYAVGRHQLTARTVLVFTIAEFASIGLMLWADQPSPGRPWPSLW